MDKFDQFKRYLRNAVWSAKTGLNGRYPNVLFITHQNHIAASQVFPFYFFRDALWHELGFNFREISLVEYERRPQTYVQGVDMVFVQPWWDIEQNHLKLLLRRIRDENPEAVVIFLDSFAPLDLRLAQHLGSDIDVYVKKQVFRDRRRYGQPTNGDTNLVDYYGKLFHLEYPKTTYPVPPGLLDKLVVGPGFATAAYMLPTFVKADHVDIGDRQIDLHARLGGSGGNWYGRMRELARTKVKELQGVATAAEGVVDNKRYMSELRASKLCFSPFGFGEVCWRDYEAIMCGALLIKPDMSHIETDPDIFQPYETYVPVNWDFSDLEEKVRFFLNDAKVRARIVENAYAVLASYFAAGGFTRHVAGLMRRRSGASSAGLVQRPSIVYDEFQ